VKGDRARDARFEAPEAQWGGVWGGVVPSPLKKGSGEGAVPPPQKFKKMFLVQCVPKIFVFRPKGGGIAQCPPPKYATGLTIARPTLPMKDLP